MKVKVYKKVFEVLHSSVRARFQQIAMGLGQTPEGKGAEYYGFGEFEDSDRITLMQSLLFPKKEPVSDPLANPKLFEYMAEEGQRFRKISRKYLYNLSRKSANMQDGYDILEVDIRFLNILALYLEYDDFLTFIKNHDSIGQQLTHFQSTIISHPEELLFENDLATQYLGFYWSFISGGRKSLRVWINYYNTDDGGYPAKVKGLNSSQDEGLDGVIYKGKADSSSASSYFYVHLKEEGNDRPLVLMGYKGHVPLKDMRYISCTASGIAKFGYPFSMELVLIKLTEDHKNRPSREVIQQLSGMEHLDFYLQFQRRNFRIPPRIFNNLETITARNNRSAQFQHLVGQYRMWSLGYSKRVVQYKFIIRPDFTANLYTPEANEVYANQRCVLSINSLNNKLCVSSHTKYGVSVINYAILDIDFTEEDRINDGVYCGTGLANEAKIVGEHLIFFKDDNEFEPGKLRVNELIKLLQDNPYLKRAFDTLVSEKRLKKRQYFLQTIGDFRTAVDNALGPGSNG